MAEKLDGDGKRSFARCTDCGNESFALVDDTETLVTPHETCPDCGGEAFSEVHEDDLERLSDVTEWAS